DVDSVRRTEAGTLRLAPSFSGEGAVHTSIMTSTATPRSHSHATLRFCDTAAGTAPSAMSATAHPVMYMSARHRHGGEHAREHGGGGHALELGLRTDRDAVGERPRGKRLDVVRGDERASTHPRPRPRRVHE